MSGQVVAAAADDQCSGAITAAEVILVAVYAFVL
jgi:hypothetical protein